MLSEVQLEEREAVQQLRLLERARKAKARKAAERERQRPRRLAAIERQMDALGHEFKALRPHPNDQQRRREIRHELRDLGRERLELKYER